MAIAFNAARSAVGTLVTSVETPSWAISGNARCMVGALMWRNLFDSEATFSSMYWGGTSFTQFGNALTGFATARLIAPTVMTSTLYGAVTGLVAQLLVGAANYTGVHQTTPLGTPVDSFPIFTDNPAISVTIAPGEWALGWLYTGGYVITPSGSQNQRWEFEDIDFFSASGDDRTGSGPVTLSWTTSSSTSHTVRAVALKPPTAFTLTANSGSYLVTGQNAPLRFGRKVQANGGLYLVTGMNVFLRATSFVPPVIHVLRVIRKRPPD